MTSEAAPIDLSAMNRTDWGAALQDLVNHNGSWTDLGTGHTILSHGNGATLIVTFEATEDIRSSRENAQPLGLTVARANGWGCLSILADKAKWFRDPALYAFFDTLVDDDFFEDYDQVIFYGEGMCGYAAAAYSVAAPGAQVVAIAPQATLDPRVTEWDHRFQKMRRVSFTDRYGFAPDMIEAAARVFVLYDPEEELDAMHAALFSRDNVTKYRCTRLGKEIASALDDMQILEPMLTLAAKGALTSQSFGALYRARRNYAPYLRSLVNATEDNGRDTLSAMVVRNVLPRKPMPRLKRAMKGLVEKGVMEPV